MSDLIMYAVRAYVYLALARAAFILAKGHFWMVMGYRG